MERSEIRGLPEIGGETRIAALHRANDAQPLALLTPTAYIPPNMEPCRLRPDSAVFAFHAPSRKRPRAARCEDGPRGSPPAAQREASQRWRKLIEETNVTSWRDRASTGVGRAASAADARPRAGQSPRISTPRRERNSAAHDGREAQLKRRTLDAASTRWQSAKSASCWKRTRVRR